MAADGEEMLDFTTVGTSRAKEFDQLVGSRNLLTASIMQAATEKRVQFEEIKEQLPLLINACLDTNPDMLEHLFALSDAIDGALQKYEDLAANTPDFDEKAVAPPSFKLVANNPTSNDEIDAVTAVAIAQAVDDSSSEEGDNNTNNVNAAEDESEEESEASEEEYDCPICFDDYEPEETIKLKPCKHRYCTECIKDMLTLEINEGRVLSLKCPDPSCAQELAYETVEKAVSIPTMEKYQKFSLMMSLRTEPNARWCISPSCDNCLIGIPGQGKVECDRPNCDGAFCFDCSEPWQVHEGKSCAEVRVEKAPDPEMEKWRKRHKRSYKPCPKCDTPVHKTSGCNHISCSCGHQFCWICLGDWSALGGYSHFDNGSCSMYSGKERGKEIALITAAVVTAPIWLPVYGVYKLF